VIECIQPPGLPAPGGHYSPVVVVGGMVWVSGQLPIDAQGRRLGDAPFATQAKQVLANVEAALRGVGSNPQRLVQVRVYLGDIGHWAEFDALYAQWLGVHRPARAVVPVPALHHGFLIEVEALALTAEPAP